MGLWENGFLKICLGGIKIVFELFSLSLGEKTFVTKILRKRLIG